MTKKLIFCALILFCSRVTYSQILNQDASGQSSILVQGSSVNINITETQAQITHNASFGAVKNVKNGGYRNGIWGIDLKAKNKTGLANLYSDGKFSPEGTLSGLIGWRKTKYEYPDNAINDKDSLTQTYNELRDGLDISYSAQVNNLVDGSTISNANKIILKAELKALTRKGLAKLDESLSIFQTKITLAADVPLVTPVVASVRSWVQSQAVLTNKINNIAAALNLVHVPVLLKNTTTYHYLRIGASTSKFTYDKGNVAATYDLRFMDTVSTTFFVEYGFTKQFKMNFVGFNLGYSRLDNVASLTTADYTYNYQDTTLKSGKLTKQQAFTGYSGKYGYYGKFYLNIDFQHLFTIDESKYLAFGPYLRFNDVINASDLAKNNTVFGVSLNYMDGKAGKFLGGIYLQSDDISGQTEPKFKKTIKFGINAKFNLSSIFLFH